MKCLFILYLILSAPLLTVTGLAITLSNGDESPERLPFTLTPVCDLPCWQGIEPGRTRIDQASQILLDQGYTIRSITAHDPNRYLYSPANESFDVWLGQTDAVVTEIRFIFRAGVRAGNVMVALGQPHSLSPNVLLYQYNQGIVSARLQPRDCLDSLSPRTQVTYISLTTVEAYPLANRIPWQGFAPNWRYLRVSPRVPPLAC